MNVHIDVDDDNNELKCAISSNSDEHSLECIRLHKTGSNQPHITK